ncbi:hypothetical protein Trisim1_008431 [Trichoderma cf. simile WF8]
MSDSLDHVNGQPPISTSTWRSARLTVRADYSWLLRVSLNDPPYMTIGEENGDDLTTVEVDRTVTLDEEQWCIIAVLPCGRDLYDVTKFVLDAPGRKRKKNLLKQLTLCEDIRLVPNDEWNDGYDEERQRRWDQGMRLYQGELRPTLRREPTVQGLYLGYSMYMHGPVVIRPSRPGDGTPNVRHQVGCANFEGCEFKVEPDGSVAGRQTIPHFLMTMSGNLIAAK